MAVFICQGCGNEFPQWTGTCPQCGNTESIRVSRNVDKMLDRVINQKFRITKKLGQGGMGAVYLAEQVGIGQKVALKFLKSEFSNDPEIARRFLNEAKSYARVAHPNAVTLHDFGQDEDNNLFIAMEYCEGTDLKRVLAEQGRLPMHEAVDITLQVADVLANAHEKGVVHRDLKPENIMIRRGLRGVHAKVLDFGIARLMEAGTRLTVAGSIAGTPRYMSPEQVEGKDADHRADIYSLGIVTFEMLTGVQPFDGNTIAEILRRQVLSPLPLLRDVLPELDLPDLEAVLQKACEKKREGRWDDMTQFATALSRALPTQSAMQAMPFSSSSSAIRAPGGATATGPGLATPAPMTGSTSGVAVPGVNEDLESSTGETMMKTGVSDAQAGTSTVATSGATAAPGRTTTQAGVGGGPERRLLDMSLLREGGAGSSAEEPIVLPPNRTPLYVGVAVGAVALGALAFLAVGSGEKPQELPVVARVETPPPAPGTPSGQGGTAEVRDAVADVVRTELARAAKEQTAVENLGKGKTEFENARLEESITYLKQIPDDTASFTEAKGMLEQIEIIKKKLADAQALKASGQCSKALPIFQDVQKLNPRNATAQSGIASCKAGTVSTSME